MMEMLFNLVAGGVLFVFVDRVAARHYAGSWTAGPHDWSVDTGDSDE